MFGVTCARALFVHALGQHSQSQSTRIAYHRNCGKSPAMAFIRDISLLNITHIDVSKQPHATYNVRTTHLQNSTYIWRKRPTTRLICKLNRYTDRKEKRRRRRRDAHCLCAHRFRYVGIISSMMPPPPPLSLRFYWFSVWCGWLLFRLAGRCGHRVLGKWPFVLFFLFFVDIGGFVF